MSTKAKSPAPAKTAPNETLESRFSAALALCQGGKAVEGRAQLEALLAVAEAQPALARAIRIRLEALAPKAAPKKGDGADAVAEAILRLNAGEAEGALKALEKVKGSPRADYLRAAALARLERPEESAAALRQALAAEPDLFYTFRMEPDFKGVRSHPAFQSIA